MEAGEIGKDKQGPSRCSQSQNRGSSILPEKNTGICMISKYRNSLPEG